MLAYASRRLLSTLPVLLITVTICFFVMRLAPGGPFDGERALPPTIIANLRAHYNLDEPLWMQYLIYLGGLLRFDLGPSMVIEGFTVNELLAIGLPFTLQLGLLAFVVATVIGLVVGILSALFHNRWPDYVLVLLAMLGLIIPNFLMANLFQLAFGVYLDWLPTGGYVRGSFWHLVMPASILVFPHAARIARLMRGSMIEVLGTNFIRTARSKGIGERLVLARHAIKPALLPVISYLGPGLSALLTGSLVVEQIFGLPGIGKYFIEAALTRDYGLVLGTTIIYLLIIVALNLVVDLLYAVLDPRVRYR